MLRREILEHRRGQAGGLCAEHEPVTGWKAGLAEQGARELGEGEHPRRPGSGERVALQTCPIAMHAKVGKFVIVEPGATQLSIV